MLFVYDTIIVTFQSVQQQSEHKTPPSELIIIIMAHQNDSGIKMASDENHFNVSLTVRDKVTRQCSPPPPPTFEEKGEPKRGFEPRAQL